MIFFVYILFLVFYPTNFYPIHFNEGVDIKKWQSLICSINDVHQYNNLGQLCLFLTNFN